MSIQVKRRREAAAFLSSFTGAQAELIVDTTNNRLQVHDGTTAGGWPAAKLAEAQIIGRTTVSDANYSVLATDVLVSMTALTASRTITLPASSAYPVGRVLRVLDESGAASASPQIVVAAQGADTVDGGSSAVIQAAYGSMELVSNGAGKWFKLQDVIATLSSLAQLGIATAADPNNPLSATLNAALFNALATTYGGTGDVRVKLNKQTSANTASFQFQDGYSGRAEIGLTGDDNFHLKVSSNGSTWIDALDVSATTGEVTASVAPPAGDSSSALVTSAWVGQNRPGGLINKFHNGTMDVWQRGYGPITVATGGAYTADGWIVSPTGASVPVQRGPGRAPTLCSLQILGAPGATDIQLKQRVESYVAAPLAGQIVTVQAQIYNNTGAAITPTLSADHPTATDNWAASTTDLSAVSLQPCPNGAWTRIAYTFLASASAASGLEITFDFGNNFGASVKSLQVTELDIRATPGVATGLNANPPPPELRPVPLELLFCQRYFQSSYDVGVAPGSANVWPSLGQLIYGTTSWPTIATFPFPAPMRAHPSGTIYSPKSGAAGYCYRNNANLDASAYFLSLTSTGCAIGVFGVPISNEGLQANYTFSAEL